MQRFWLFFYGLPNILGMTGLLIGLLIYMLVVATSALTTGIMLLLALIPILCYGFMALVGILLQKPEAKLQFEQTLNAEQIRDELEKLLKRVKSRIAPDAYNHLENIQASMLSVLPQLVAGRFGNHDLFTLKQMVLQYLPTTLENYLKLPPAYASIHPIQDGKTAKVLLTEQLTLMDTALQRVVHNIVQDDAQALLVNQRFLQQKFLEPADFLSV